VLRLHVLAVSHANMKQNCTLQVFYGRGGGGGGFGFHHEKHLIIIPSPPHPVCTDRLTTLSPDKYIIIILNYIFTVYSAM